MGMTARHRWFIIAPLALIVGLSSAAVFQQRIDTGRSRASDEELLYLPNDKLLNHFTAGMSSIVADMLWLECIQYTSREFHSQERKFTWLDHIANTVVRLDPYFTGAYQFGGTLLAAIGADGKALDLLERGCVKRPDRYEIPFEIAKIYVMNRRAEEGAAASASYFLTMAAGLAPAAQANYLANWAYAIQSKNGISDVGQRIWEQLYQTSSNSMMRELAARNLQLLGLQQLCDALNGVAARYAQQHGRAPQSLDELRNAGLIQSEPPDPLGGHFFIDQTGQVQSSTLLDDKAEQVQRYLQNAVNRFRDAQQRWPESLEELVQTGALGGIPPHPYPGRVWQYAPATGEVYSQK